MKTNARIGKKPRSARITQKAAASAVRASARPELVEQVFRSVSDMRRDQILSEGGAVRPGSETLFLADRFHKILSDLLAQTLRQWRHSRMARRKEAARDAADTVALRVDAEAVDHVVPRS